ncbi:acyltransferase [Desulfosporosinus sp. BG]|uniref:acyltransferase n=1 Tax=Desulfosporosinus sp. BG TaxID=1633135 RepID=UPI00083AF208|nr:acyltransferase [Desulfosporosinus sp. BG]ODA40290.1 Maltose O-acetyltransferase [Desulfosporosinus sp. BG]
MKPKKLIMLNLLLKSNGFKRAEYLKRNNIFREMGKDCFYQPVKIPSEPFLVSMGNNVRIAANVTFLTHDIISGLFNNSQRYKGSNYRYYTGRIEILDDVFIGANSTIMYDIKIGPNSIVAAGSVVTKDVPPNTIVGGNPAKVIGNSYELAEKRMKVFNDMASD